MVMSDTRGQDAMVLDGAAISRLKHLAAAAAPRETNNQTILVDCQTTG